MFIEGMHEKNIYKEDFPFRIAENSVEDFNYPMHWHSALELLYVEEGSYDVNINNKTIHLDEKDLFYIAPGDLHGFSNNKKGQRLFIQFVPDKLVGFGIESFRPFTIESGLISRAEYPETHRILEKNIFELVLEYKNKSFAYMLGINARLFDVMKIISRSHLNKTSDTLHLKKSDKLHGLTKLGTALDFINANYTQDISLKEVSRISSFSEYHFSRIFKEIMEMNFHSYLNELRVRKAERLLSEKELTISEIAALSGFNSFTTFNRIFKEFKGCPPSMYRKYKLD